MITLTLPATVSQTTTPSVLRIEHLTFAYPDGHRALRDVTLSISPGEKVALVGPNGAGKSTLMLHLNGILGVEHTAQKVDKRHTATHEGAHEGHVPHAHVYVAGMPVVKENLGKVRALVGMVFQQPDDQLFSPTVWEDVAFGPIYQGLPEAEVRRRVDAALAAVHMSDYANRVSHHLSVGEKKRIAIATVLSMDPQVLVLDEPSAGLDPRARRGLINLLRELPQTILVTTHDLPLVRDLCPRTVIMDSGEIVADGATSAILEDDALLEAHGLERM